MDTRRAGWPWHIRTLCLLAALLLSPLAAAETPEETYQRGVDALQRGAYEEALEAFTTAQAAGLERPALHYNLGVSYYRLGRYFEARSAFLAAAASPSMAPLAYYNLALIAVRERDNVTAVQWLRRVLSTSDNPNLNGLAQELLERIAEERVAKETPGWSGFALGSLGYDSNVLLLSDTQTLTASQQDDIYLDVFGYGYRRLRGGDGEPVLNADVSAYALKYQDLGNYDIQSLRIGGSRESDIGTWVNTADAHFALTALDGNAFTREVLLGYQARAQQAVNPGLRLRYELGRIDAMDAAYTYLDGWRHKAEARVSWFEGPRRVYLLYQLEYNDRSDRQAPQFTSFSPLRQALRAVAEFPIQSGLDARVQMRFRHSRYRDPNEIAPGTFDTRVDDRFRASAELTKTLGSKGKELSLEYSFTDNESTIKVYEYRRYRVALGLFIPW